MNLSLNHAGSLFSVTKLHMLRLSSTWNCYQLLFNTQMEWSVYYLTLIREGTKHLTVECHLTSLSLVQCTQPYLPIPVYQIFFFPFHIPLTYKPSSKFILQTDQQKIELLYLHPIQLCLQMEKLRQHESTLFDIACISGTDTRLTQNPGSSQHENSDINPGSCPLPPYKQVYSSTYLRSY